MKGGWLACASDPLPYLNPASNIAICHLFTFSFSAFALNHYFYLSYIHVLNSTAGAVARVKKRQRSQQRQHQQNIENRNKKKKRKKTIECARELYVVLLLFG